MEPWGFRHHAVFADTLHRHAVTVADGLTSAGLLAVFASLAVRFRRTREVSRQALFRFLLPASVVDAPPAKLFSPSLEALSALSAAALFCAAGRASFARPQTAVSFAALSSYRPRGRSQHQQGEPQIVRKPEDVWLLRAALACGIGLCIFWTVALLRVRV